MGPFLRKRKSGINRRSLQLLERGSHLVELCLADTAARLVSGCTFLNPAMSWPEALTRATKLSTGVIFLTQGEDLSVCRCVFNGQGPHLNGKAEAPKYRNRLNYGRTQYVCKRPEKEQPVH